MLHKYKPADMNTCLAHKQVVFIGDSVTRNLYYATVHTADPSVPETSPENDEKHANLGHTVKSTDFSFVWDPFLNTSAVDDLFRTKPHNTPFLVVLGSGLWYLRHQASSGGLAGWEARMEEILSHTRQGINSSSFAEHVAILPVEKLVPSKLSKDRASSMKPWDVEAMNADLKHRVYAISPVHNLLYRPTATEKVILPLVFNEATEPSQTEDGLHYGKNVLSAQASILLNAFCNPALPKTFPFDKTCCRTYPTPSIVQALIILIVTFSGPICLFLLHREGGPSNRVSLKVLTQVVRPCPTGVPIPPP
jgi:hypothetical protein